MLRSETRIKRKYIPTIYTLNMGYLDYIQTYIYIYRKMPI